MKIRLASPSDDIQLRKLVRETIMPGHIRMIYAREPNFFESVQSEGEATQVIVAEDNERIVAQGCRSVKNLYVNGKPQPVGYLSGLRLADSVRNGTVLARGYSYLKQLHSDNKTTAYLTTIIQGNQRAKQILTSKRAGLPSYTPMGTYLTYVVPVQTRLCRNSLIHGLDIVPGTEVPKDDVLEFLSREGPRRQFFPVTKINGNKSGMLDSIGLNNLLVARRDNQIMGVMAIWNQEQCKQYIIAGYSRLFKLLCPWLNVLLRIKGYHPLPSAGRELRYVKAALVCIRDDDPDIFLALLRHALNKAAGDGIHQFALGIHERDPFRSCMKKFFHIAYRSGLYLVSWDDNSFLASLDKTRIPYLELGTL
jgi:hypothetical protein